MEEKKVLSAQEFEAQTLLELPDRKLLQVNQVNNIAILINLIFILLRG
jgi:hypothetical protein